MKILGVGGGSGGHVTPVLAVINELEKLDSTLEVQFVCDKRFVRQARELMSSNSLSIPVHTIVAGKFRRYHGVSFVKQLLDIPTTLRNIRDVFLVAAGIVQSLWLLGRWRPDVVFTKGGFVCLPVGIAAHLLRIPLVIHDSDAHPGLTNRILARWASVIATGAPLKFYSYPEDRSHYTGIPIDESFMPLSEAQMRDARGDLGLPDASRPLIVVTGGGLGARRINQAMLALGPRLIDDGFSIVHITGQNEFAASEKLAPESVHYKLLPFVSKDMARVLGAADVVVTRAGATTMLELAAVHAAVVIIPNPMLTGGHQLKNAEVYKEADAAMVVDESTLSQRPELLYGVLVSLLRDTPRRQELGEHLGSFARPEAALEVAQLIVDTVVKRPGQGTKQA